MRPILLFLLLMFLSPLLPATATASGYRTQRLQRIEDGIRAGQARLEHAVATGKTGITTRDLANAALGALAFDGDALAAQALLHLAFAAQNMDPSSPSYGEIPWDARDTAIHDLNADEFTAQPLGPLLLGYGSLLPASLLADLRPHLEAAITAMTRRSVAVSYTNIYLMKAVDLLLLGQALPDLTAETTGRALLHAWVDYTNANGIHEFDSPTYYAVDLDSLSMGYLFARLPADRRLFKNILAYFWHDLAANLFDGSVAGSQSRDYDFLGDAGGVDLYLYAEGLRPAPTNPVLTVDRIYTWLTGRPHAYHPPAGITAAVALPERIVTSRWDAPSGRDRYNYLTPDFAIGSASGAYGPQDKLLQVLLLGSQPAAGISVVPDALGNPYGTLKVVDSSGHAKPQHLPIDARSVQERGTVLSLLSINARHVTNLGALATSILFPADSELALDEQRLPANRQLFLRSRRNGVVAVRRGQAAVAIRVFHADGCAGRAPILSFSADRAGLKVHAERYLIDPLCRSGDQPHDLKIGLLIVARSVADGTAFRRLIREVGAAPIQDRVSGSAWSAQARIAGVTLTVQRDLSNPAVDVRLVNGMPRTYPPLALNGKSYHITIPVL